jgi:hemolysin activation/secretion protein
MGLGADFNSLFGLGDLAYVRINGYPSSGDNGLLSQYARNRSLAAGVILPIGLDGTTLNIEGTLARTTPQTTALIGSTDLFDRLSFRLRHPWIRSRDLNVSGSAILDIEDETSSLIAGSRTAPLSQDRLRVLRFNADADYLTPWGATMTASVTASFGLNALGARSAADASALLPLSRQDANDTFSKLEGTVGYSQALMEHLATNVTAHAQTSFGQALLHAEQMGITGPTMLSAFESGLLVGDTGFIIRDEISAPFATNTPLANVGGVISPYLFGAVGEIFLQDPTALERSSTRAASYGLGIHLGAAAAGTLSNGSLTLELARQARNDGQPIDNRVTLVTAFKF